MLIMIEITESGLEVHRFAHVIVDTPEGICVQLRNEQNQVAEVISSPGKKAIIGGRKEPEDASLRAAAIRELIQEAPNLEGVEEDDLSFEQRLILEGFSKKRGKNVRRKIYVYSVKTDLSDIGFGGEGQANIILPHDSDFYAENMTEGAPDIINNYLRRTGRLPAR